MNAGFKGFLGSIVAVVAAVFGFGLFIGPVWTVSVLDLPNWIGYLVGGLLGVAASAIFVFLPAWLVRHQVPHLGEG